MAAITTEVAAAGHVKWCKKASGIQPHDVPLLSRVKATTTILCFAGSQSLFHKYTPHLVNLLPPVSTQNIFQILPNVYQKTELIMHFAFL